MAHALIRPAFRIVYARKASLLLNRESAPLVGVSCANFNDPHWETNLSEREGFERAYPRIWKRTPLYIIDVSGHKRLDGASAVAMLQKEGTHPGSFFRERKIAVTDTAVSLRQAFAEAGFGDVPVMQPEQTFLPEVVRDLRFHCNPGRS